ncbi:hypothetical protein EYW98_03415 [Escherichia coli]|uniref:hypothetical protein n=1 Tax=Escherichia sp. MOD1-EC7003 TaxID=2093900 RepID=UPI000CF79A9A|nr:hypothetical protein [Escherichia sp. MOD1-EC7003]EGO8358576.1 hypothetical protein [Escherichia coli]EGO8375915.1 hypothetical protein [Escherichia coli]
MRRKLTYLAMAAVMSATPVLATDVSIDFEATITVPTCNMTITGDAISGFGTATGTEFTLEFGDVSLYDIAKKPARQKGTSPLLPVIVQGTLQSRPDLVSVQAQKHPPRTRNI